jgi:hypothetical protein
MAALTSAKSRHVSVPGFRALRRPVASRAQIRAQIRSLACGFSAFQCA